MIAAQGIQLAAARELASAGVVREVVAVGVAGGFGLTLRVGMAERTLLTQRGAVRIFRTADAVADLVRTELGLISLRLELSTWLRSPT